MRKDYTAATTGETSEIEFVARYWTEVWNKQGGPKGGLARMTAKPEYRIMAPYLAGLPEGARILDGGCGLGEWTIFFRRKGYQALGIDISAQTIARLREIFPDAEFTVADIRESGLPGESFDTYFSWGVFEHFEEGLHRCVAEAFRLLKPGGLLFVTVPFDNLRHALAGALASGHEIVGKGAPLRFYQWRLTRAELARELSIGGFVVLDLRPIHKRQGVLRFLSRTFHLRYDRFLVKAASAVLAPFVPAVAIAHMVMAVARKPE